MPQVVGDANPFLAKTQRKIGLKPVRMVAALPPGRQRARSTGRKRSDLWNDSSPLRDPGPGSIIHCPRRHSCPLADPRQVRAVVCPGRMRDNPVGRHMWPCARVHPPVGFHVSIAKTHHTTAIVLTGRQMEKIVASAGHPHHEGRETEVRRQHILEQKQSGRTDAGQLRRPGEHLIIWR